MKAPDKIYIPLYPNYSLDGFHLADEWMYEPHKECDNVTYIRKDALLEWAEEKKEQVGLGLNAYDMGEENGKADILNALIDLLNKM